MSNVLVEEISLENIASAIRNKNGLSSTYTPSQMASAISAFEKNGFDIDDVALRTISGNMSGNASFVSDYAFRYCSSFLTAANFPNCTSIGMQAFYYCSKLTTANFPNCISMKSAAFAFCRSLTTANFPNCTYIGNSAFQSCFLLTTISIPNCTSIPTYTFYDCRSLTTINFPNCSSIGSYAFYYCSSLTTISFPVCTNIGSYAFSNCRSLTVANFPKCSSIGTYAFRYCYNLLSLYLNSVLSVTSLGTDAFNSSPIGGRTTSTGGVYGSVFVPMSLVDSFKTATNWAAISDRIVGCNTITSNNSYYSNNFTSNGLTFSTDTTTGIVTANGTTTGLAEFVIMRGWTDYSGGMQLFCCPSSGSTTTYYAVLCTDRNDPHSYYKDYGSGVYSSYCTSRNEAYMCFLSGQTFSNFKFKPILINIPS